jgi:hypothetical protein
VATAAEISNYLKEHPKAVPVLKAAIQEEDANGSSPNYLGWEWYQVRAYPATLMKLVIDGLIRVNFKSNSSTCYKLADKAAIKQALAGTR